MRERNFVGRPYSHEVFRDRVAFRPTIISEPWRVLVFILGNRRRQHVGMSSAFAGADQKPRTKPTKIDAVPSLSCSTSGLSLISSGRMLYLAKPISVHFSPIGRK